MKWEPKLVSVSEIKFTENNPKIKSKKGLQNLRKSVEEFGLAGTLIVNRDLTLIDGNYRLRDLDKESKVWVSVPERQLSENDFKKMNALFDLVRAGEPDMGMVEEIVGEEVMNEWDLEIKKKNTGIKVEGLTSKITLYMRKPIWYIAFNKNKGADLKAIKEDKSLVPYFAEPMADFINSFIRKKNTAIVTTPKRHEKSDMHFATMICKEVSRLTGINFIEDVFQAENKGKLQDTPFKQIKPILEDNVIMIDDVLTTGRTVLRCRIPDKNIFYLCAISNK